MLVFSNHRHQLLLLPFFCPLSILSSQQLLTQGSSYPLPSEVAPGAEARGAAAGAGGAAAAGAVVVVVDGPAAAFSSSMVVAAPSAMLMGGSEETEQRRRLALVERKRAGRRRKKRKKAKAIVTTLIFYFFFLSIEKKRNWQRAEKSFELSEPQWPRVSRHRSGHADEELHFVSRRGIKNERSGANCRGKS